MRSCRYLMYAIAHLYGSVHKCIDSGQRRGKPVYEETERRAFQADFSPEAYLDAMAAEVPNQDSLQLVVNTFHRYEQYDQKIQELTEVPAWQKPWVFMRKSEKSIREAIEF